MPVLDGVEEKRKQGLKSRIRWGLCPTEMGAAECVSTRQGPCPADAALFSRTATSGNRLPCGFGDPSANGPSELALFSLESPKVVNLQT